MNIPYTVETRPDTGLNNGKLGIWLFLASEVMLFGALFSTYIILRTGAPVWPHGADELSHLHLQHVRRVAIEAQQLRGIRRDRHGVDAIQSLELFHDLALRHGHCIEPVRFVPLDHPVVSFR